MTDLLFKFKPWHYVLIVLGVPLILLVGIGVPIYYLLGDKSPIWHVVSTIGPAVSALTIVSLVILTLLSVFTSMRTTSVMEATLRAQTTPSIVAYFDNPVSGLLDLVVKNTGYGSAKEVHLNIAPPLLDYKDRDINELSLFKQGIKFFPPNREFRQIIGTIPQFFGEGSTRSLEYELTISYRDSHGNSVPDQTIYLDLSVYHDLPIHRESDITELTKEVAKLRQAITQKKQS
jgi:hypothetical protein